MTPTIIAISLKMYFGHARTRAYCRALAALAAEDAGVRGGATDLIVLPTFVSIPAALEEAAGTGVRVGAQDLAEHDVGAFTGEVSGAELAEMGCTHVEVGHAERRTLFGETDAVVATKTRAALRNGLTPILCVGEPERADPAAAAEVCLRQVVSALPDGGPRSVIVAYEPHWAIGTDRAAPTDHVAEVCRRVRAGLVAHPAGVSLIYGGSAGPGLLSELSGHVDGLFLGRFGHDPEAVAGMLAEASVSSPAR